MLSKTLYMSLQLQSEPSPPPGFSIQEDQGLDFVAHAHYNYNSGISIMKLL